MPDFDTLKSYFGAGNEIVGYIATLAAPGRPTLRPVSFFLAGRKICFCAGADNAKIAQIEKNPYVEICLPVNRSPRQGYYRLAGRADIVSAPRTRKRILRHVPYNIEDYWDGPDDPRLAVVVLSVKISRYLEPGELAESDVKL